MLDKKWKTFSIHYETPLFKNSLKTSRMLYFIGLGLGNEEDITLRGLKAVKSCEKVFLEHYTSILGVGKEALVHNLLSV